MSCQINQKKNLLESFLIKKNNKKNVENLVIYYSVGIGKEMKKNQRLIAACSIMSVILIEVMIASVYLILFK